MSNVKIKAFFGKGYQVVIPDFQRNFSWKPANLVRLFDDILYDTVERKNGTDKERTYGTIIALNESRGHSEGAVQQHILIDGQQRFASVQILLLCLRHILKDQSWKEYVGYNPINVLDEYLWCDRFNEPRMKFNRKDGKKWGTYLSKKDSLKDFLEEVENKNDFDHCVKKAYDILESLDLESALKILEWIAGGLGKKKHKKLIPSDDEFGMKFNRVSAGEHPRDLIDAYDIFERENNRGISVKLDDLVKTYLVRKIQLEYRNHNTKLSDFLKVWKTIYLKIGNLTMKNLITWFIQFHTSKGTTSQEDLLASLRENMDTGSGFWSDPNELSEEILKWVVRYEELTKKENTVKSELFNYFKNLKTIWGFFIPLSFKLEDSGTEIDEQFLMILEKSIISSQITDQFQPRDWNARFKKCRTDFNKMENGDYKYKVNNIVEGMIDFAERRTVADINELIEKYDSFANDKLSADRKKWHTHILRRISIRDRAINIGEMGSRENHFEHILPNNTQKWRRRQDSTDPSLLRGSEITKMQTIKNHIGNHTLLHYNWNIELTNRSFFQKKYVGNPDKIPEESSIDDRKCYRNSQIPINTALLRLEIFNKTNILERGHAILRKWASIVEICTDSRVTAKDRTYLDSVKVEKEKYTRNMINYLDFTNKS